MSSSSAPSKKAKGSSGAAIPADDRRSGETIAVHYERCASSRDLFAFSHWLNRLSALPFCCCIFLSVGRLKTKVRARSVIDPETRRLVALQRLAALEQDNYEENTLSHGAASGGADAAYDNDDEEVEQGGTKGKKRKRGPTAGSRGAAAAAASADAVVPSASKGTERAAKATVHRTRNLDHVIAEEVSAEEE